MNSQRSPSGAPALYPLPHELQPMAREVGKLHGGNFGLWYNKLAPHNPISFAASNDAGVHEDAAGFYADKSVGFYKELKPHLDRKHRDQLLFCDTLAGTQAFKKITLHAVLTAPLALGLGEAHPNEISLLFDHTLGVPYIPATSVKGVTRLAHMLDVLDKGKVVFDKDKNGAKVISETNPATCVPELFGLQERKGRVIFLDAYPLELKKLRLDIVNPHYGDYYQDEKWPGDYLDPVPVKFLTVPAKTEFLFRVLADCTPDEHGLNDEEIFRMAKALRRALTGCGFGGKTAVGYGRFAIKSESEPESLLKSVADTKREDEEKRDQDRRATMSPDEIMIMDIGKLTADANKIGELWTKCKGGSCGKEVFIALKARLETLKCWKPSNDKQQLRNQEIEKRING